MSRGFFRRRAFFTGHVAVARVAPTIPDRRGGVNWPEKSAWFHVRGWLVVLSLFNMTDAAGALFRPRLGVPKLVTFAIVATALAQVFP